MFDDTVSFSPSEHCPGCGGSNWLIDQGDGSRLHANRPTKTGDRACNDCGAVWAHTEGE